MPRLLNLCCLLVFLAFAAPAFAQTTPLIIDQNRPDRAPPAAAPLQGPRVQRGAVQGADLGVTPFVLREVRLQGSTAPKSLVDGASRAFVGQTVDGAAVNRIADAVGAAYAKSDIALYTVLVPRQTFADGVLRLIVVEGYVADVEIKSKSTRLGLVKAYAARLKAERPLKRATLERYMQLTRDIPGLKLDVQILQERTPGAVKMVLDVKQKRFQAGVGVNTRGTEVLGRTQVQLDAQVNSVIDQGDQAKLSVSFPTDFKRFVFVSGGYSHPIGATGATLGVNLGRLETRPQIAGLPIKGSATIASLQGTWPVVRGVKKNLYLTASLDALNSSNAVFGFLFSDERVRALRVAAAYSEATSKSSFSLNGTISQGIDGLGARPTPVISTAGFTKLNGQASYSYLLKPSWVVRLAAGGQYSSDRLPASEQFALGGPQFGRGFQSAILVGDRGYAGSAELAYRPAKGLPKLAQGSEAYVFADAGKVNVVDRGFASARSFDLASAGGGFRIAYASKGMLELEAAKGINRPAQGYDKSWRLMVTARSIF